MLFKFVHFYLQRPSPKLLITAVFVPNAACRHSARINQARKCFKMSCPLAIKFIELDDETKPDERIGGTVRNVVSESG